ncbi:FG-GAP repeat protein [Grimontia sp. NTOU-MAR1]|uniref:FG-GAP repeat protein n=1 Tax=Grimontia sp. NTOU-MAR1 TaxID=3111011 RepID=UPI002DBACC95|nr:FG-GAP repeat protein [Grimontia sp. NTOU-MAR1]WRV98051.1 FG-GAP repeat protein [Grimontia sp. NTOU-MAR1]
MYFFKKAIWVVPVFSLGLTACGGDDANTSASVPGNANSIPLPGEPVLAPPQVDALTGDAYPVTFSWSSAANATGYTLCRKDASQDDNCAKQGETTTNTSLTLPLSLDTPANYFVLAKNSMGSTASAEIALFPKPEQFTLVETEVKTFQDRSLQVKFSWNDVKYAQSYTLCRKDQSQDGKCAKLGETTNDTSLTLSLGPLENYLSEFFVLAENSTDKTPSVGQPLPPEQLTEMINYIKASNTGESDDFGYSVSLSKDGNTLAVGAYGESSNTTSEENDDMTSAGAVYVYRFDGSRWTQEGYIKASNPGQHDAFGYSVSVSGDGNTLAVGVPWEDTQSGGIDPPHDDTDTSFNSGAVYVYRVDNGNWTEEAFIKASDPARGDYFSNVSLSSDGDTLAVGVSSRKHGAGAVYVYHFNGTEWAQKALIEASNKETGDHFGTSVSWSENGKTLAVGADTEKSDGTDKGNNSINLAGAVYVYRFTDSWTYDEAYIKASSPATIDKFGHSVSLSSDGATLAVGAIGKDAYTGAVYVYHFDGSSWTREQYIQASNKGADHYFGYSVSLSSDGNTLAVGAYKEKSNAQGINGEENNDELDSAGAAYVYHFDGSNWTQQAYIKASNTGAGDEFGKVVSVSGDGNTLAVGAAKEASDATGINGEGNNNDATDSGAVYVF